jgi:hypothetical protein
VNAEWIGAAIFIVTSIFVAGKLISGNRAAVEQSKIDINRIGQKIREEERANLRRHFNMALMMVASEEDKEKRFRIAGQLREDN